jgi:lipopolysaccharide export system protein LptC
MKFRLSFSLITKIPVAILVTGILFSCVNDLDAIQKVTHDPNAPEEVTRNLNVHYTDSGYARVQIFATLAETYSKPSRITKLKDGIRVNFFGEDGKVVSKLTALYGEIDYETGKIVVRDSVILRNLEKKQFLETEELFWNQKDSTIYSNKNVIVKTDGDKGVTGHGKGIRANQSFSWYKITKPVGEVKLSGD